MDKKGKNIFLVVVVVFISAMLLPASSYSGIVDVYLEGAYDDDDNLDVYIYADCNVDAVISYGVRVEFIPADLTVVSAAKNVSPTPYTSNETLWELGDSVNKDNPDPVILTNAVVFKGGILDEAQPKAGITETFRVFLGSVRFQLTGATEPADLALSVTYAEDYSPEPDSYKNFVRIDDETPGGVVIDSADDTGVDFSSISIYRRGDANGDGMVTNVDMGTVRNMILNGESRVYADANGDGMITNVDMGTIRNIILGR
jgi:hypothetical protein